MSFSAIEKMLENLAGLDSSTIGSSVVQRVIRQRMELAGISDVVGYHIRLKQDPDELQALIEDVTVPETWFFRDREPFDLLAELVRGEGASSSGARVPHILSVPCATGEEAYSIAMVMLELGYGAGSVHIDAVDISKRVLQRAVAGEYRANSFRGDEGHYRQRYFEQAGSIYRINEKLRGMVSFRYGNLIDEKFLVGTELYDVIFCRNVMIYFPPELQEKTIRKLHRLLTADGLLFVGYAEAAKLNGELFSSVRRSGAFAFRKRLPDQGETVEAQKENGKPGARAAPLPARSVARAKSARHVKRAAAQTAAPVPVDPLFRIRRLADQGRLEEASRLCLSYLEDNAGSAEAYYLLGLIREAEAKNAEAANLFRKAAYLNPHHYDALVHLAVLAEAQGNRAAAVVYRARASRLAKEA
jgi:chemotaxis protein methyltransferase WspC